MAVTINYTTYEIDVPKTDTVFIEFDPVTGREKRSLDITVFGKALGDIQDDEDGAWASTAYVYTQPISVGGISLGAVLAIQTPYKVTFEAGDWAVFLINGNTNIQDVSTVNGVSVYPSNSGGLVGADEISNQSYLGGKVFINSIVGTADGIGTPTDPTNSYANALTIATTKKLNSFDITGTIALTASDDVTDKRFYSATPVNASITLTNVDLSSAYFERIDISGSCSASETSPASFSECFLGAITNFWGSTKDCIFYDDITQHSSATGLILHDNGRSGVAGDRRFTYNVNGAIADLMWRNYIGGQDIAGITQGFISYDGLSMRLELLASCTGGEIVLGGTYRLVDNSAGTTVITDSGVGTILKNTAYP